MYGDVRTCQTVSKGKVCNEDAKLVQRGKDYCCDCYARVILGKTMEQIDKELQKEQIEIF